MRPFREHHYLFAHQYLPHLLWREGSLLDALEGPSAAEYLRQAWNDTLARARNQTYERVEPQGLSHELVSIGDAQSVHVIRLPEPEKSLEAYFVAVTRTPTPRYFTLERGSHRGATVSVFCERTSDGKHHAYGPTPGSVATEAEFLAMVAKTIEAQS